MGNPLLSMVNKYTINLIYDNQMQKLTHNNLTNREKIINHVKNKNKLGLSWAKLKLSYKL